VHVSCVARLRKAGACSLRARSARLARHAPQAGKRVRDAEGVVAKQAAEVEQLNAVIMEADKARRLATGAGCLCQWASGGAWRSAAAKRAQHRAGRQP